MYIIAQHNISDAQKFWTKAKAAIPSIPNGLKLHTALPNPGGSKGVCLWEADSIATLKAYLEPLVGAMSRNEYIEVDSKNAFGLPAR